MVTTAKPIRMIGTTVPRMDASCLETTDGPLDSIHRSEPPYSSYACDNSNLFHRTPDAQCPFRRAIVERQGIPRRMRIFATEARHALVLPDRDRGSRRGDVDLCNPEPAKRHRDVSQS